MRMSRNLKTAMVASTVLASVVVGAGEAYASGFSWHAWGVGQGFTSRTWTTSGTGMGLTLSSCQDDQTFNRSTGRVAISFWHNYTWLPDVYVGSNSWSCDLSPYWKGYPNASQGTYHWTLDSTPNNGDAVDMTGVTYYN
jgi:hypothetical protein